MASEDYIDVKFDIFEYVGQRARVKKSINVRTLKDEILREFDDIPADDPDGYAIYLKGAEKPLDEKQTLSELDVQPQDELVFDHFRNLIRRMLAPKDFASMVEDRSGKSFEIQWQPALIGRPSTDIDHNIILAVNLQSLPDGNWISREHAQVTLVKGKYFVEPLAEYNPVYLNGKKLPFRQKAELKNGDKLLLGPKKLPLTFYTRSEQPKTDSKTDPMSKAAAQVKATPAPQVTRSDMTPPKALDAPYLMIRSASEEGSQGKIIRLEQFPFELGRMHPLLMGEKQVSRKHIRIEQHAQTGNLLLTDLESTNGVYVDGKKIPPNTPVEVGRGTQIGLGTVLMLQLDG
ncbi:FHA domain-containing protein [bacterium]|nr:FHA domain-containing protein [bacterium]